MNYGGDAADQIVRYTLDGVDHGLRLSGTMAKNLAVFFAAVLKDQKKTHGKTRMIRMLKDNRPLKFFTVPTDRIKEFCQEGKKRGLLYVVIKDKKNPQQCEVMVFADDAAKVNRVMDLMNLDFLQAESAQAAQETVAEAAMEQPEMAGEEAVRTETVEMPEGEVRFEISDFEDDFNMDDPGAKDGNFTKAQGDKESLSAPSSRSSGISTGQERESEKPSVRKELEEIKQEKQRSSKSKNRTRKKNIARKGKRKSKTKGR